MNTEQRDADWLGTIALCILALGFLSFCIWTTVIEWPFYHGPHISKNVYSESGSVLSGAPLTIGNALTVSGNMVYEGETP